MCTGYIHCESLGTGKPCLTSYVLMLNEPRYLCVSRTKNLSSPEMEGVDTLLMYLYRALHLVDDMEKLASSQNSCIVVCTCPLDICIRCAFLLYVEVLN